MVNKESFEANLKLVKEDHMRWEVDAWSTTPLMEALGDDRKDIEKFLLSLSNEDLNVAFGLETDLYEKWPDKRTEKFIEKIRNRLFKAGYNAW